MRLLLACFPKAGFRSTEVDMVSKVDGIDLSLCPYVTLPNDWNGYLESLSANTRQKIRRLLKQVDTPGEYRITVATPETFAADLKTLLRFWEARWRSRKGDRMDGLVRWNDIMLTRSFQSGMLYLPTFWHGDRPVAALATLMDPRKRTFSFYMTGRDETFDGPPSGVILHAFSIRHAIENGFSEYDFLRGNEPYKYSFGCAERKIRPHRSGDQERQESRRQDRPARHPRRAAASDRTAPEGAGGRRRSRLPAHSGDSAETRRCVAPARPVAGREG